MSGIKKNTQYNEIRNNLEARNLYNPSSPYEINNTKLVNAINSIASFIPGKSIDITNTVIGRVFLKDQTPIMKIGLHQYSKHLAQSITSYGISDALPSANLMNLFDGDPTTKLLTKKEDYRITRDETKTSLGALIQDITNQSPKLSNTTFTGRGNVAPFDKFPNQYDYIRNTGKGQLNQYYGSIGYNLYVQSSEDFISVAQDQGYKINKVTKPLLNKDFYPLTDPSNFPNAQEATDDVRSELVSFRESAIEQSVSEYGSNIHNLGLGKTRRTTNQPIEQNLPDQDLSIDVGFGDDTFGFENENIDQQIVWGRDTDLNRFGVRGGALLYTKGLLQAKGSRGYFDQTKKKITHNGLVSYNGSPMTKDLDGNTNLNRQSTILDQYNRYAKAIRFEGNQLYQAPSESVISKTVIPKMHPIIDTSKKINNNNMMFSIENLAYILNDKGYTGDLMGTKVPQSEVGANKGRLMWFAPYDVEVNETATAKYETTQFIGRGEPLYTYQTSERSARLNFKLIIDYPPHVDGMSHGDASKFFAFGGRYTLNDLKNIDIDKEWSQQIKDSIEVSELQPEEVLETPTDLKSGKIAVFYFHNDGFDVAKDISIGYENGIQGDDGDTNDFGLNVGFSDKVNSLVNEILNEETFKYYNINFIGRASRLYYNKDLEAGYNKILGKNRAQSLKDYVENIFRSSHSGLTFQKAGIKVNVITIGSDSGSTAGSLVQNISLKEVKEERNAYIELVPNGTLVKKIKPLTPSQVERRKTLEEQILKREELINAASKVQSDERIFNEINKEDRIFKGFEAMKKITLSPVFHSQTPEDFHRRLTFLHQCTRQGNSVINKSTDDSGISVPRNSVFGRPPICVLRLGDMFHSKVIIESVDIDYTDSIWDVNPEGMGMQFMIAEISMSMKLIGGQSLKSAIDVIQNAESFNYYANSTYYGSDVYQSARKVEEAQVKANTTLVNEKQKARFSAEEYGYIN